MSNWIRKIREGTDEACFLGAQESGKEGGFVTLLTAGYNEDNRQIAAPGQREKRTGGNRRAE